MASSRNGRRFRSRQARSVTVTIDRRLVIDVRGLAERMGRGTIARIRELAAQGRGYRGTFGHLTDTTIERYERDGISLSSTKSVLRRTGTLLDGLRAIYKAIGNERYRVNIYGPIGRNRETGYQHARRPFLGLSSHDLRRLSAGGAKDVMMRSVRSGARVN